jgi:hypothetical protein
MEVAALCASSTVWAKTMLDVHTTIGVIELSNQKVQKHR